MANGAGQWILVVEAGMRDDILIPGLKQAGYNAVGTGSAAEAYRKMSTCDFSFFSTSACRTKTALPWPSI